MAKGLAIILAAGEGTRMRSQLPKVLHEVGNQSLIAHVAAAARACELGALALVVGPDMGAVAAAAPDADAFVQAERRGTAHAVLAARDAVTANLEDVVVLLGDAPLVRPQTIAAARAGLAAGADLVVVGFRASDPFGYGRLIVDGDRVKAIREERDASDEERSIDFCNSGIMAFSARHMLPLVEAIGSDNAKNEFYLTDAVAIADQRGLAVRAIEAGEDEVMGINDRAQLARCEALFQARMRAAALAAGVTLTAPETVFFSADTVIGADVTIEPNVVFGRGVTVEAGARIHPFCHLERAKVAAGAEIGPFARLRPGAEIGAGAKIGNFVEVKNATFGAGAKANHLAYVGDATVGEGANIGAGTITCNYDGYFKYETRIGAGAFIGSNSALVAPVTVGEGAYVGSGSVITQDVPDDALAIGRGRQVIKEGRAKAFREAKLKEKEAAKKKG